MAASTADRYMSFRAVQLCSAAIILAAAADRAVTEDATLLLPRTHLCCCHCQAAARLV